MRPSRAEKSSQLTSHPTATFLLRAEDRSAGDVRMCQLREHTVHNLSVTIDVCVGVCVCVERY